MEKRREILASTYLFKGAEKSAFDIELSEPVDFLKGQTIYSENQFSKSIGVVLSGLAKALPVGGEGVLSYFREGSVFGAAAVFSDNKEYISRIEAVKPCKIQFIEEEKLSEIFKTHPQVAVNYISFLSTRIRFLNEKLSIMMRDGAESRLYAFLLKNGGYDGKMTGLANTLCMGRTTLYRTLENLEQKQLIVRQDGKIKVIL
jgi:CRP-like cAMP-binding protein